MNSQGVPTVKLTPEWYDNYVEAHDGRPDDTIIEVRPPGYESESDRSQYKCRFCELILYDNYTAAHEDNDNDGMNREWLHMIENHETDIAMIRLGI